MKHRVRFAAVVASLLFALTHATPLYAQYGSSIQGTVTDKSGAVVPQATITATNQATGVSKSATSSDSGVYRISGLPPGRYQVTAEAASFQKRTIESVVVDAETVRALNVTMVPGAVSESVTVSDAAPGVDTDNGNVAGAITARQVIELPQVGRDPYELLRLAPGVFGDSARNSTGESVLLPNGVGPGGSNKSIFQVENQVQISSNGQRVSGNNFLIDGVDVNSLTWGGAAVVTPNQESVQEVKVLSSSYAAEDGRGSGAQIKVISRSGSNTWHGSGFMKYDEPGLNAFNKFAGWDGDCCTTLNPQKRVGIKERQFGGSFGGPVKKDKLFFFFSYEGLRRSSNDTKIEYIETPALLQLLTSARAGGVSTKVATSAGMTPRVLQQLTPSCADIIGGAGSCQVVNGGLDIGSPTGALGQYVSLGNRLGGGFDGIPDVTRALLSLPGHINGNQYNGRVDWNLSSKDQLAFSTYISRADSVSADADSQSRPSSDISSQPTNPAFTFLWNHSFSGSFLNEARVNFSRFAFNDVSANSNVNFGLPRIEIENTFEDGSRLRFGAPRSETTPGIFAQNTYAVRDVASKVMGKHALKFGFEMRREQDNNNLIGGARPDYSNSLIWNFFNDTPIFESINVDPNTGAPTSAQRYFRSASYAGFGQTDWKMRPNFTLTLGLRYEYFQPLSEKNGHLTNLVIPENGGLPAAFIKVMDQLFPADKNNVAPRIGFAWQPWMSDKAPVFRGGFGVFYNRIPDVLFANTRGNPPFFARFNICCGTSASDFSTPFAGGQITYVTGTSNSLLSFPINPALTQGLNSTTNLPNSGSVEIWGTPAHVPTPYVYNYSLEVEQMLPAQLDLTLGYQGSSSHKLIRIVQQDLVRDDVKLADGSDIHSLPIFFPTPDITANFNSLNVRVDRRFKNGFTFDSKYRWSKSMDELSNEGPGFVTNQTFPRDLATEYSPSDYDATHALTVAGVWELPFLRGRHDLLGNALGGWQISGIVTAHSGFPWTPVAFTCITTSGNRSICPTRPIAFFGGAGSNTSNDTFLTKGGNFPGGGEQFFDVTKPGTPGIGRNSFRGPHYSSVDLTFGKNFNFPFINEGARLNFRANVFNIFNKLNLAPFGFASSSTVVTDQFFGVATDGLAGRVVEFQARLNF